MLLLRDKLAAISNFHVSAGVWLLGDADASVVLGLILDLSLFNSPHLLLSRFADPVLFDLLG